MFNSTVIESKWLGRSLENYKSIHKATATTKGCLEAFLSAKTLTQAKKILFGEKFKRCLSRRDLGADHNANG